MYRCVPFFLYLNAQALKELLFVRYDNLPEISSGPALEA